MYYLKARGENGILKVFTLKKVAYNSADVCRLQLQELEYNTSRHSPLLTRNEGGKLKTLSNTVFFV